MRPLMERAKARTRRSAEHIAGVRRFVRARKISLTFDDGPWPGATDRVLDALARLEVEATFFCVGKNARAHRSLLAEIVARGHSVGSHSYSHPHPSTLSPKELWQDYLDGAHAVSEVMGREVRLFRPPHGHTSPTTVLSARQHSLDTWLWSQDTEDWRPHQTANTLVRRVAGSRAHDVILCHDWVEGPWHPNATDRSALLEALPLIVNTVRQQGLSFGPLR